MKRNIDLAEVAFAVGLLLVGSGVFILAVGVCIGFIRGTIH